MSNSYDLTERLLWEEQDRQANPDNWRVFFECRQCGKTRESPMPYSDVDKARQVLKFSPNEKVVVRNFCAECNPDTKDEEEAP